MFSDAFPTLEPVQRWLGGFVLLREALYLLAVGACAWVNPAFLLVDVAASVRDEGGGGGYGFLAMYVVAPEKYVRRVSFDQPWARVSADIRAAITYCLKRRDEWCAATPPAREKALGNGDGDLERIKAHIKRLKFGTIELSTEQAFLKAVLESRPLPKETPTESEGFKALQQRLKNLTNENERRAEEMERSARR